MKSDFCDGCMKKQPLCNLDCDRIKRDVERTKLIAQKRREYMEKRHTGVRSRKACSHVIAINHENKTRGVVLMKYYAIRFISTSGTGIDGYYTISKNEKKYLKLDYNREILCSEEQVGYVTREYDVHSVTYVGTIREIL